MCNRMSQHAVPTFFAKCGIVINRVHPVIFVFVSMIKVQLADPAPSNVTMTFSGLNTHVRLYLLLKFLEHSLRPLSRLSCILLRGA